MQIINQSSRKRKELELLLEQVRAKNGQNGLNKSLQPLAEKKEETYLDDIAIIGMAGRFPGSPDLASFWQNLKEGKNLIGQIPQDRWPQEPADDAETQVKHIGAISDVFAFDAGLFGISPREAEAMDPHQRVLLEVVWETLEHAGYSPGQLSGSKTGVFIAMYNTDFLECSRTMPWEKESLPYLATGISQAMVSNRISYLFNWQGPSEIISTACSSALVGLHKAAQAIRCGDCEVALVGGVSLLLSPSRISGLSRLGILSLEGYCAPFDQDSPGEVLGEGAGAVLLKPLSRARQDGDTVYALLKASGTNHHGNSSGSITMPSVYAQRDLLVDTYRRAGIEPQTISFIEAHGSGNVGGDMAELVAFEKAFASLSQAKQNVLGRHFCGIGSGKGNTGFLEAAGGMAQLIKVILSLQHKTLPATLNFKALPASIDLKNSPFYIVAKTIPWPALKDDNGQTLPRRAALNSYGLGGTNAHIVVEEYDQGLGAGGQGLEKTAPHLIVLSAQNEERLKEVAKKLQHYMAGQPQVSPSHLQALAYTLQVGRKAMKSRLALLVDDADMLREKLAAFIAAEEKIERCYQGQVKPGKDTFQADEAMPAVSQKNLENLAELWVKGWDIDWSLLYGPQKPCRISLPTYPFAKEQYRLPTNVKASSYSPFAIRHSLHPLVQQNISDLAEQRYRSVFTGEEFFWRDHQIKGQKVLPGVAYLELARAAAELAGKQPVVQLKNIAWVRPIKVDGLAQVVSISLASTGETLSYKIETPTTSAENEWLLHGQGQVVFGQVGSLDPVDRLDIAAIQSRCVSTLQGTDCYRLFQEQGRYYGPGFQTVQAISYNDGEVLARLQLPAGQGQEMRLSLGLMDGALQAIMGLYLNPAKGQAKRLELPFALAQINIYGDLPETIYAYGRYSQGSEANEAIVKYDIAMADEQGEVRVGLKEFTMRTFSEQPPEQARAILYSTPAWQVKELAEASPSASQKVNTLLITIGLDRESAKFIGTAFSQAQVIELPPEDTDTAATVRSYLHQVWEVFVPLLEDNFSVQQVVVLASESGQSYLYAPFIGLLKSAQLEHPKVQGKIIVVPTMATARIEAMLQNELRPDTFDDIEVRYHKNGQREVKVLREIEPNGPEAEQKTWLKPGGVYWITGGLGGLGRIFARHLSEQGQGLKIILSGRSALDEIRRQQLDELRGQGTEVQYFQVDVAQPEEVERAFRAIKTAYGQLDGLIHAAGIVKEGLLRAKSLAEVDQVLAPKVAGVINLDRVTQAEKLDFVVLFSSIAAIAGHVKQWDYAAGNAFLDKFAAYRQGLVEQGQRSGKTLALSWSHWQDGGMQADEQALKLMKKLERITGMASIETNEGLKAFDQAMSSCESQVVVAVGLKEKIKAALLAKDFSNSPFRPVETPKIQAELTPLREKVVLELKRIVARLLKLNLRDISEDEELQIYGFNSISFIAFVNVLNDLYGLELTPTLVFEYNSLAALSDYLLRHHQDFLVQHYQTQNRPQAPLQTRFRPTIAQVADTSAHTSAPTLSSLVPLRSSGTRPPFFCVHPWAGMVYPYYALADELGPDQPFYGLQAVGLYQAPHRSIEEMAGHYLEALRTVQPAPPYLLGGWSLGGLIAFEMAQQLQRSGQEVDLLALIDMPAPLADKKTSFRAFAKFAITEAMPYSWPYIRDYFQLMASVQDMGDKSDPEAGSSRLLNQRRMIGTVLREVYSLTSPQTTSRRLLRTLTACMLAGSNYTAQPYPGRATLFRVQQQAGPDDEAQTMGWQKLVAQGVEVHHLPGHHFDILRQPQVQTLAAQLKTCIDQV